MILIHAQTARASSITVTTTADELVSNDNCSLREAILAANTDSAVDSCPAGSGDDTIHLPAGSFSISLAGANEDGNATGDLDVTSDVTIVGEGSSVSIIDGGGLDRVFDIDPMETGSRIAISGVTIQNGLAAPSGIVSLGGGILNRGTLSVERSAIRNNTGSTLDVAGAGIYNLGTLVLTDSTVAANGRTNQGVLGGGLGNASGGTMTIRRSTLVGNSTGSFGGGIDSRGVLTIENSTISGNVGFYGGGISNNIGGRMTISNCTVTANRATFGGGILNNSQVTVKNSILALNIAAGSGGDCLGGVASVGHNLDSDGTCGLAVPGDLSGVNPLLGSLADNGGSTETHALPVSSPAVDAGNPTGCSDQNGNPLTSDQRGVARPLDGDGDGAALCDIGAFELAPPNAPPVGEAGDDRVVECAGPGGSVVTLDGTGSADPDSTPGTNDDIVAYDWFEDFGTASERLLGTGAVLEAGLALGAHFITLRIVDSRGASDTDAVDVRIVDTTPPSLTLRVSEPVLWPPNHELVRESVVWEMSDGCDAAPQLALESVSSSEPDDSEGTGDGSTSSDISGADLGTADGELFLRAERAARGSGRVYELWYQALDGSGNAMPATAVVTVPRDQGHGPEPLLMRLEPDATHGTMRILWPAVPDSVGYDVIAGDLAQVRVEDHRLVLGDVEVLARGTMETSLSEDLTTPLPPPGTAFFYLIQPRTARGGIGYGTESAPRPRVPGSCEQGCP